MALLLFHIYKLFSKKSFFYRYILKVYSKVEIELRHILYLVSMDFLCLPHSLPKIWTATILNHFILGMTKIDVLSYCPCHQPLHWCNICVLCTSKQRLVVTTIAFEKAFILVLLQLSTTKELTLETENIKFQFFHYHFFMLFLNWIIEINHLTRGCKGAFQAEPIMQLILGKAERS